MYLVSTSKKTVLSDFADLETKSTYIHANGESTDFQFNAQHRVFVEVDKKAGLAVMRIKEKQQSLEIQRVRKLTIDNAYSVCCAKSTSNQIGIGQSSGSVRLYNFRTADLIHRYPYDQSRRTVLFLDYNCTDEYIAAVLENGRINVYGTKTKLKIETITIDDNSSLARFHPCKRFQLGIASYKGAVNVYDMQAKRSIFSKVDAHDAPCRDLSMCSTQPSLLVSVGYDCKINIFDIRRNKAQSCAGRLNYAHPLSTVALSECGTYFCAGNLKGELISYDMRSTKLPLAVRNVHDGCAVVRVAFVPITTEEQQSSSFTSGCNSTMESGAGRTAHLEQISSDELRKSIQVNLRTTQQQIASIETTTPTPASGSILATPATARQQRDSFCDFLDAPRLRGVDRMSTRLTTNSRRDSFDWDALHSKAANDERPSIGPTGSSGLSSLDTTVDSLQQTLSGPLRDRSNVSADAKLKQIAESDEQQCEQHEQMDNCSLTGSDKENPTTANLEQKQRLRLLPASRNSTPHQAVATPMQATNPELQPQKLLPQTSSSISSAAASQHDAGYNEEQLADITKSINELRTYIEERFVKLENDIRWINEKNKCQILEQLAEHLKQQSENTTQIRDGIALLLREDKIMTEFTRLQYDNDILNTKYKILKRELDNSKKEKDEQQQSKAEKNSKEQNEVKKTEK